MRNPAVRDLAIVGEVLLVVVATWVVLGWVPGVAITQNDGSVLVAPYTHGSLAAGANWSHYLYRFGVLGGSEMHPFGGTLPIVQLCALLGVSTTATMNATTWLIQIAFASLSIIGIESLASIWAGAPIRLSRVQRIAATWLCGFAPVVGWRLGTGHENLLLGLLPYFAALVLMLAASARRVTATVLALGALAVAHGISGLGPQTVVYGTVFGAPLALAAIWAAPKGARWSEQRALAIAALVGAVLMCVPRLAPMIAHTAGTDAIRSLDTSVVYSFGHGAAGDWLGSLPWTVESSTVLHKIFQAHEWNYPVGPLAIFIVLLWPRGRWNRARWAAAALVSAVFAICLADNVEPISTAMLRAIPLLSAFRVPSRAILPLAIALPMLALAAWAAATHADPADGDGAQAKRRRNIDVLAVAAAIAVIAVGRLAPSIPREIVAWLGCGALAVLARWRPALLRDKRLAAVLAPIAALGVAAFFERIPAGEPRDTIEDGPITVHDAVVAQVPSTAMALNRVEFVMPPLPFQMSLAWAADLGSIDGVWFLPRRALVLWFRLVGEPVIPVAVNWQMWGSAQFPFLQQLYNIVAYVNLRSHDIGLLPTTAGPAWVPANVAAAATVDEVVAHWRAASDLRAAIAGTAWIVDDDRALAPADVLATPATCAGVHVASAALDDDGGTATIALAAPTPAACTIVIASNYVSALRAIATIAASSGELADAPVFPVDVALTGVEVPAGTISVDVFAAATVPGWTWLAAAIGALMLVGALAVTARGRPPTPPA